MSVTCVYRGVLGELDRLKLQEELHGKDLAEALALVQGLEIPAVTEEDAPAIIVVGFDPESRMLFLQVGKGAYAYEHAPPVSGGEVFENDVILPFLKGLVHGYGAFSRFKQATSAFACRMRVRGLVRTFWLISQFKLDNIPLCRRPDLTPEQEQEKRKRRKGKKRPQETPPTPPLAASPEQLRLF